MILPALADVHAAAAVAPPPRRAGGGGKRARLGAAPALASIMEGVPSLAEDDVAVAGVQQQQQQQQQVMKEGQLVPRRGSDCLMIKIVAQMVRQRK